MKRATFALAALLASPLAAGCSDLIDDSASSSDNFALGDAHPGTNADQLRRGEGELRPDRDAAGRPRADLQRTQLLRVPRERRHRRRRPEHRAALRHAHQRRVQRPRQHGRLAAPAVRHRRLQPGPGLNCQSGTDANPAPGATIFAGRVTTPTFGLGLVELIPDGDAPGHRGGSAGGHPRHRDRRRPIHLDRAAPSRAGSTRVARFGWKAVHASLADFAADAYLNEMGITTTSCAAGTVVNRLRDREPRQPRAHQRRHQRLPRRPGAGHRRRLRRGGEQLRRRPHRGAGRRGELRVLHAQPGARPRAASTTATAAA